MPKLSLNSDTNGIKLKTLCERISVNYDEARYTLARGVLPKGVKGEPGRGNHRVFTDSQAFHLAVVLKLKAAGITTPLAATISEWSRRVQHMSVNLSWDPQFAPFAGKFTTERRWLVDIGDARFVRLGTDANPSGGGQLNVLPWVDMNTHKKCKSAQPAVIFRIDLVRIAELLIGAAPPKTATTQTKVRSRTSRLHASSCTSPRLGELVLDRGRQIR